MSGNIVATTIAWWWVLGPVAEPDAPVVSARVVSAPPFAVGTPFRLSVSLEPVPGATVSFPSVPLDLGAFVVVAERAPTPWSREYAIVPAISGSLEFPPLDVLVSVNAAEPNAVRSPIVPMLVETRAPPGPPRLIDDLQPIGPPAAFPTVALLLGALAIAVLAWFVRRAFSRRAASSRITRPPAEEGVVDPEHALARLESRLQKEGAAAADAVVIETAALLRLSIARRLGFPAPRRTSDETIAAVALSPLVLTARTDVATVLVRADDAKYGGTGFDVEGAHSVVRAARQALEALRGNRGGGT